MPLCASSYPPGSPVYTWIANDGTNIHVDSNKLRAMLLNGPRLWEIFLTPVYPDIARGYITDHVVDMSRVQALDDGRKLDPIIFGRFDAGRQPSYPDTLHIDGHHRYVLYALKRFQVIPTYLVPEVEWRKFEVTGLMNLSQDQLRAAPTKQRNY